MKAIGPPPLPDGWEAPNLDLPRARSLGLGRKLWFVRHAEVAERWHETAYGSMNVELSPNGQEQTRAMARAFKGMELERILSSDLDRARLMGEGIAEACGAPIETSEQLREMDRGEWQGLDKSRFIELWQEDAQSYWTNPFTWHVPGGEGDQILFQRAYPLLEEALSEATDKPLVVTAHGQLIRVLISRFLGLSVPAGYEHYPDPAHGTCLVDGPKGWEMKRSNQSPAELQA
jgi:broad specificity phosphatase PhoE